MSVPSPSVTVWTPVSKPLEGSSTRVSTVNGKVAAKDDDEEDEEVMDGEVSEADSDSEEKGGSGDIGTAEG